jgi:transcriptional regulator with XRE-family HTH domain
MYIETANRLYELRKKNGLSQEELADKLGISRQAVSK